MVIVSSAGTLTAGAHLSSKMEDFAPEIDSNGILANTFEHRYLGTFGESCDTKTKYKINYEILSLMVRQVELPFRFHIEFAPNFCHRIFKSLLPDTSFDSCLLPHNFYD